MEKVTVTILVDNQAAGSLMSEHGLSMWIEIGNQHILFDTGQGALFVRNARALGIDLQQTRALVLSHGHYDHTGGVAQLFQMTNPDVYCHAGVVRPRYAIYNGKPKPIHMPHDSMAALDRLSEHHLHWVQNPVLLSETCGITGPIPRRTDFEDVGGPFFLDPKGIRPDSIEDDLALWIRTADGLIVIVGCCHAGLVNTLRCVQHLNEGMRIKAVIGGFHLMNAERRRLDMTIAGLQAIGLDTIVPCHCTGTLAVSIMREALGEKVAAGAAGMVWRF